jgi:hypothetical protein
LVGPDTVPTALASRGVDRRSVHATIVYCGDAMPVSEGFAIAPAAMEANANRLMNVVMPTPNPKQEDD